MAPPRASPGRHHPRGGGERAGRLYAGRGQDQSTGTGQTTHGSRTPGRRAWPAFWGPWDRIPILSLPRQDLNPVSSPTGLESCPTAPRKLATPGPDRKPASTADRGQSMPWSRTACSVLGSRPLASGSSAETVALQRWERDRLSIPGVPENGVQDTTPGVEVPPQPAVVRQRLASQVRADGPAKRLHPLQLGLVEVHGAGQYVQVGVHPDVPDECLKVGAHGVLVQERNCLLSVSAARPIWCSGTSRRHGRTSCGSRT